MSFVNYILYIKEDVKTGQFNHACQTAMMLVAQTSIQIYLLNINRLSTRPSWLMGYPSLLDRKTYNLFQGSKCLSKLRELQSSHPKESLVTVSEIHISRNFLNNLPMIEIGEFAPITQKVVEVLDEEPVLLERDFPDLPEQQLEPKQQAERVLLPEQSEPIFSELGPEQQAEPDFPEQSKPIFSELAPEQQAEPVLPEQSEASPSEPVLEQKTEPVLPEQQLEANFPALLEQQSEPVLHEQSDPSLPEQKVEPVLPEQSEPISSKPVPEQQSEPIVSELEPLSELVHEKQSEPILSELEREPTKTKQKSRATKKNNRAINNKKHVNVT